MPILCLLVAIVIAALMFAAVYVFSYGIAKVALKVLPESDPNEGLPMCARKQQEVQDSWLAIAENGHNLRGEYAFQIQQERHCSWSEAIYAPNNLITLCTACHKALHAGKVTLNGKKRGKPLKDVAFMGIMRKTLMERLLKELKIPVQGTYGYITKYLREKHSIPKSHTNDARCISKNPLAIPCDTCYYTKAIRHHNRQLHKATILKGGIRKANQSPYTVKGYRLWDKVSYNGSECFITSRRTSGYFALKKLDGTVVSNSASYKKMRLLEVATNYITERR